MFDLKIPFYSIMILLALVSNLIVVAFISRKYSFTKQEMICLLLYENIGMIGGAKILAFLQNYKEVNGQFDFLSLGLSSYGAVIGALLFLVLFCLQFKKSFIKVLYIFTPSIPLMYGIGKIGCFLAGCCYGIVYSGFASIVYNYSGSAPPHTRLFPIQIVEAIFFIAISVYMVTKHKKNQFSIKTVGINFILCGVVKFALEFLRDSHIKQILSSTQVISIVFTLIGAGLLCFHRQQEAHAAG